MTVFYKALSGTLIAVILGLVLSKQGKDLWVLLSVIVCCMVITAAAQYLRPIISFLEHIQQAGSIDLQLLKIILKAVGIGILSEITSLLCADSGNSALAKCIQLIAAITVIWLSLPLFEELFKLIETILGTI